MALPARAGSPRSRQPWTARARAARAARRHGDAGFTLVEVLVSMVILGLVVPGVLLITRNLSQQATNIGTDVQGVQEDQTAGEALYPYLQSATAVLADSTGTYLDAEINLGFDKDNAIPNTARLQVTLEPAPIGQQTTLVTSITPTAGPGQTAVTHSVGTYFALYEPNAFIYYYNTPNGPSGVSNPSALAVAPSSTVSPTVQISDIVEVEVNITFLAGPNKPLIGYKQIQESHYNTTVYLENAIGSHSKQTDLNLIAPGQILYSSATLSYLQAVISPAPDVGTVVFTVDTSSMSGPQVVCAAAAVLGGVATCPFNAPGWGGGTATAQYQPPANNQEYLPSQIVETSIESFVPTQITFGSVQDARGAPLVIPATVSLAPSAAGGPTVPATGDVVFTYYLCPSPSSSTSSSTTSSTTATGACSNITAAGPDAVCLPCGSTTTTATWIDQSWSDSGDFPDLPTVLASGSWIEVNASYQGNSFFAPSSLFSVPFQLS